MSSRQSFNNTISSNLAHSRTRINPTNTHTNIFEWQPSQTNRNPSVRCTPTFHSQIFPNKQTPLPFSHSKQLNRTVAYGNKTKDEKQAQLNHGVIKIRHHGKGIEEFYDQQKFKLITHLEKNSRDYAKERKGVDLSSHSIYDLSQKQQQKRHLGYDTYIPCCSFK